MNFKNKIFISNIKILREAGITFAILDIEDVSVECIEKFKPEYLKSKFERT
jgi:hypothetical protein